MRLSVSAAIQLTTTFRCRETFCYEDVKIFIISMLPIPILLISAVVLNHELYGNKILYEPLRSFFLEIRMID